MYPHRTFHFLEPFKGKLFNGDIPTLAEIFQIAAARYPDKKCLTTYNPDKFVLTFREARDKILTLAASLVEKGVRPGDRVILTGKNRPEWAVAYYAIATAGAIIVPLDYTLHEDELKNLIEFSEPVAALVDKEKYDVVKTLLPADAPYYSLDPGKDNYVLALENAPLEKPVPREVNDLVAILYTSGTTGIPKGVMLSNSNLVNDCFLAQMNMQIYHTDVFYAPELVNPNQLPVVYSSSDETLAIVDDQGEVMLQGESGRVTITATFEGDDYYKAGEASYDIVLLLETGISTLSQEQKETDAYYTIQGVRVNKPTRGLYIRKGKKVVMK